MRLLYYNIQDPLDPQVNGFGFYRTAVDGVIELLDSRQHIGGRSNQYPSVEAALTQPWEASDCTDQTLVPVWAVPTQYTFTADDGTAGTAPSACTASTGWEIDPIAHANNDDISGYRATQPWEHDFLTLFLGYDFVQNHITWAYSSTLVDDGLGAEVEFDNDPPVGCHLVAPFQEHMFIAGDPDNPHFLYFSKRFHPEAYPTDNFLEIGNANDPITSLVPIAGLLGLFTRDTKYRVSGNATTGFLHYEAISRRGTRATKSVVPSDQGIIFVANDGVFTTNLIGPDKKISGEIESLFTGITIADESPINQDAMDQVAGCYYKSKYYFVYPSGTATTPDRMAVYSFDTEEWTMYALGGGSMFYEPDTDNLVLGGDDSFVYVMESGDNDNSDAISAEMRTKDYAGASYNTNNLFVHAKVDCEVADGATLTVKFYVDDDLKRTFTVAGPTAGRSNELYDLPENTFGTRWRVVCTVDDDHGDTKIYGIAAVFIPLQVA